MLSVVFDLMWVSGRLADQLLQEAVGQVCTELQEASDSLAAQLFSQEFHITTT